MITIYDIAKECGCSSATVSKVFNRTGNISEKKRREVLEAAERLGYVPNVAARSLVRQRSNMVGVLLFIDESLGLRHGLFAEILNRFRAEMEKHNFEIVLISEKGEMWGGRFLDHCRALRLDGVFCLCCNYDAEAVRELIGGNIPLVAFESPYEEKPSIESKNFEAAKPSRRPNGSRSISSKTATVTSSLSRGRISLSRATASRDTKRRSKSTASPSTRTACCTRAFSVTTAARGRRSCCSPAKNPLRRSCIPTTSQPSPPIAILRRLAIGWGRISP